MGNVRERYQRPVDVGCNVKHVTRTNEHTGRRNEEKKTLTADSVGLIEILKKPPPKPPSV